MTRPEQTTGAMDAVDAATVGPSAGTSAVVFGLAVAVWLGFAFAAFSTLGVAALAGAVLVPVAAGWARGWRIGAAVAVATTGFCLAMLAALGHADWSALFFGRFAAVGVMACAAAAMVGRLGETERGLAVAKATQGVLESQIEQTRLRTERVLESSLDAALIVDGEGRLREFNPAAEEILGWSRSQALGRDVTELITPDDLGDEQKRMARYLATGEGTMIGSRVETVARRADGSIFPVELAITLMRPDPSPMFLLHLRDITERKRFEAELVRAKTAAEEASRAKSDFLATMSHEIRTPMNGIIGMISLLLDTELEPVQREYAETVRSSSNALLTIINDILDFSKIEAGKLAIEAVEFELRSMVEDVVELFSERAYSRGLDLSFYIDPGLPARVIGDPTRIRQVLSNLIGNAVKFTHHGTVVIRATRRAARDAEGKMELLFEVQDTGIGLEASTQERLFRPFAQADSSTSRRFGGTGLGLAISKRLTALMGGEIGVESDPGQGSRFWFSAAVEVAASVPAIGQKVEAFDGLQMIVADPIEVSRTICGRLLCDWGIQVEPASDGQRVLDAIDIAAAEGERFDAIILDVELDNMAGVQLARALRTMPATRDVPILLMFSLAVRDRASMVAQVGASGHVTKPLRPAQLRRALEKALGISAAPEATRGLRVSASEPIVPHGRRLLIAEDNFVNQKVTLTMVERLGYEAEVASNGAEVLERLDRSHFDAILMDVQMPEMDGYAATRAIRERSDDCARIPIIAMTANAMEGDREKCLACGMDDYVAKPVVREELVASLERWAPPEDPVRADLASGSSGDAG